MKERKTQNQIKVFTTAAGNVISYPKDIKTEVVGFYKILLGQAVSHIPGIHPAVIRNGPTLTRTQQFQFIQPFAAKDVETTLKEISNDKYLRINRFNSHFFKQSWSIIGQEGGCNYFRVFCMQSKLFGLKFFLYPRSYLRKLRLFVDVSYGLWRYTK
ncbi:hypothetical protein P3S67_021475 [Capsicum chacoense]